MMHHIPSYKAGKRVRAILQSFATSAGILLAFYVLYIGLWIVHNGR